MSETQHFLLIGHGKTGSTYVQRRLAESRETLRAQGVHYPKGEGEEYVGNGANLFKGGDIFVAPGRVVYSNEWLWRRLLKADDLVGELEQFQHPRLFFIIRDPIEHAVTTWRQAVKRGRKTPDSLDDHFATFDIPFLVRDLLRRFEQHRVDYQLVNYSRVRNRLLSSISDWVGIDDIPPGTRANRSLTQSETDALAVLHGEGVETSHMAHLFAKRLPDEKEPMHGPAEAVQLAMLERLRPALEEVNGIVDDQGYRFDLLPEGKTGRVSLSHDHLRIIAEVAGTAKLNRPLGKLVSKVKRRLR